MWQSGGGKSSHGRHQQLLHPISGQPVAFPPSQSPGSAHSHGSVYINSNYDPGGKDRVRRPPGPDQELIVIDYADNPRDGSHGGRGENVRLVDLS